MNFKMKNIIPIALSLVIHFSALAQEHNMPMPKEPVKEKKMDMDNKKKNHESNKIKNKY